MTSSFSPSTRSLLRIADVCIAPALGEICKGGHTIKLEPRAMQVLICLALHPGEVISVNELLDAVWKDVVVGHDSVYTAVATLRRALGDDPKNPTYIANVARRGYRLIAPVSPCGQQSVDINTQAAPLRADRPSIVVMPFLNLSGDLTQDYLSDGLTEDITTELSRWHLLAVRPRSASFRYRGIPVDTTQVARDLNVRFVLEGSVRRMGDRVRISVRLVDADSGSQIWVEKFDRRLDEIFAVQDRLVQTIVSTLVGRVQLSEGERARRKPPTSLDAYECVMKANLLYWDDPAGAAEATQLIEKAIELDCDYGFAHALAAVLCQHRWLEDPRNSDAALQEAYALATRAVALDNGESTNHAILGLVYVSQRSYELAAQCAHRAVEINPNNQWNAATLGVIMVYAGQSEDALAWFARARESDPYFDEPWYWRAAALAYMTLHRHADALSSLEHVRVHSYRYVALIAGCHAQLGHKEHAADSTAECLSMKHTFSITNFMSKEPFKNPADAEQLASSLRLAGLPD